jgi:hypothetical protein
VERETALSACGALPAMPALGGGKQYKKKYAKHTWNPQQ